MGSVRETDNQLSKIQVQDLPKPTQLGNEVNTLGSLFDQKIKPFKVYMTGQIFNFVTVTREKCKIGFEIYITPREVRASFFVIQFSMCNFLLLLLTTTI